MVRLKICDWDRQEGRSTFVAREALEQTKHFKEVAILVPTPRASEDLLGVFRKMQSDLTYWNNVTIYRPDSSILRGRRPDCFIFDDADQYLDKIHPMIAFSQAKLAVVVGKFPKHFNVRAYLNG